MGGKRKKSLVLATSSFIGNGPSKWKWQTRYPSCDLNSKSRFWSGEVERNVISIEMILNAMKLNEIT